MARYNSVNSTGSVAGGNTISTPASGLLTTLTGTGTVTLPNPVLYTGSTQTFYNSTGAAITLSTPSGLFTGPGTGGAGTLSLPAGSILTVISDGTNYIAQDWLGGAITTGGTATFNGTIAANPTNLSVSIQPTGTGVLTLSSGTTGSLDNINVGATTQGTGKFSTLIATGVLSTTATTVATLGTGGTGALQVAGGASVAGILNVGGKTYHADSVGIGTNNPSRLLDVNGSSILRGDLLVTHSGANQDGSLCISATGSAVYANLQFASGSGATIGPYFTSAGNALFSFAQTYHVSPKGFGGSWAVETDGYNPIFNIPFTTGIRDYFQMEGGTAGSNLVTLKALGSDTNIGISIQPKGTGTVVANNLVSTSISSNMYKGASYAATSTTSSMAIVDTAITNYGYGAVYQVHACGCPNVNGSSAYLDQVYGKVVIGTGWSGSQVTTYIYCVQENMPRPYDSGGGELTLDAVFWDGSTETTNYGTAGGTRQIRVKVGFPSSQGVGSFNCLISRVI